MIVPMKFVTLALMRDEREAVLQALQQASCIMLCEQDGCIRKGSDNAAALRQSEKLLADLKPYAPKTGMLAQKPEISVDELLRPDEGLQKDAEALSGRLQKVEQAKALYQQYAAKQQALAPWERLSLTEAELQDSTYTRCLCGMLPVKQADACTQACLQAGAELEIVQKTERTAYAVCVTLRDAPAPELSAFGFEAVQLPSFSGTVAETLHSLNASMQALQAEIDADEQALTAETKESRAPQVLCEHYRAKAELEESPLLETEETVILEGFVPADRVDEVEQTVRRVTDTYALSVREPEADEEVPTALKNKKTVSQFEGITNMFSVPAYGGYDPNAVMAPWYWLIFGLMMGDAGYGLMMVVLISIVKKIMKPKGDTKKLINVLLYSSVTTILCGVLFGSYFGETWHPLLFSPLDDPVKMLLVTLGIGVAHIFTGLIVQIVNHIRAGRFWDAMFDQVSWMLVISGIALIFVKPARTVGIVLAAVGAGIILCTAGRAKKGVIGKITGGLVGLYGITNYLSDILSYSRILALSLATGVVGMVMNMLAGMIQGSVIGFIFSLVIYIVGHIFNLVLGLLSAYVHDCRLQYIEFYGKFYEGSGKLWKPLSIYPKYMQMKDNGGN